MPSTLLSLATRSAEKRKCVVQRLCRLDGPGAWSANASTMNAPDLKKIVDWRIDGARSAVSPPVMVAEICERLMLAGLPLWRVGIFVHTLHPDVLGRNFIWRPGAEVAVGSADFGLLDLPEFINSPLAIVFGEAREVRCRLDDPESKRFPLFDDMRAEGVTDYIALPLLATGALLTHRAGPPSIRADSATNN